MEVNSAAGTAILIRMPMTTLMLSLIATGRTKIMDTITNIMTIATIIAMDTVTSTATGIAMGTATIITIVMTTATAKMKIRIIKGLKSSET